MDPNITFNTDPDTYRNTGFQMIVKQMVIQNITQNSI